MTVCKRIGAWLLTLVLLVSALPYTAFAASEDSHVVNATMEETSVEDIANNVTTQLLRGAKTKDETLSMEAKPTHEDSDSVEIIVVVDDSVAKPTAQAQVQSLLQKQEKAAATMSRAIGEAVEPEVLPQPASRLRLSAAASRAEKIRLVIMLWRSPLRR